jgi:hypothetical protein
METMTPTYTVHEGRRYRLKFRNASDDIHPPHPHRYSVELTRIADPLFHCHRQSHMDFSFTALFNYA